MKMLINGKETDSVSGKTAEVLSPATGEVIDTVPVADEKDIDLSLSAAETAFRSWKKTPLHERASIMMKFVELVRENRDSLARTLSMDNGKPITQAEKEIDNIFISVPAFTEQIPDLLIVDRAGLFREHMPDLMNDKSSDALRILHHTDCLYIGKIRIHHRQSILRLWNDSQLISDHILDLRPRYAFTKQFSLHSQGLSC